MLRVPAETNGLVISNDSTELAQSGFVFAAGFRNTFDLEWGPNGHLFGTENSGDRDDPEELNWIREGRHYGFPWRIGGNATPQQSGDYDPDEDPLLGPAIQPVFSNDPEYPEPPSGITFVEPLANSGPDADRFRDSLDGSVMDAGDLGTTITTFTPHRSPLGLVFDTSGVLAAPFSGDGFVLSWTGVRNPLFNPLGDDGEDLLHLDMEWDSGDSTYTLSATQIVVGFTRPIDAVLVGTVLYVIEMGFSQLESPQLWRIDLPEASGTAIAGAEEIPSEAMSISVYPQPVESSGHVAITVPADGQVKVVLYDVRGRMSGLIVDAFLPVGRHDLPFSIADLSPGVYIARMEVDGYVDFEPVVRIK
jgi:hypothetical protein